MDHEDLEHFRTIGSASAGPQDGSLTKPTEENSPSGHDPAWCLRKTQILFACYRRDEAHDPELYCAAVAAVFGDFPKHIVELACDPRTGIAAHQKFLPAVAEVKEFCDDAVQRAARLKHYEKLPKHQPYQPPPLTAEPNLFVPEDSRRYSEIVTKSDAKPERARFENGYVCRDGVARNGVWIPLDWWEDGADMQGSKRAEELSRLHFERFRSPDMVIGGQPVSKDLAEKLGAGNADVG